ncbi:MAG TPA: flippase [Chitinophagaceae bacterium]|nr:flippase [Chitinophagaceae bacterium]
MKCIQSPEDTWDQIITFAHHFIMASGDSKKLLSNFIALGIIQGANFVLPVLVMPFVIRRIGPDLFGVVSVAQVVMIFLSTVSDYGFNLTATRDIAFFREDKEKISRIFSNVLASKFMICGLTFLLLLLLIPVIPVLKNHYILYLLGFVYVIGQSALVGWFFQGMEKMQYITISTLIARLLFVALVFVFIRDKSDHIYFLFFLGVGNIMAGVFSIYLAFRIFKLKFYRPKWIDIKHELKEGWHITVSNLSINTYQYINIVVLRLFTNDLIVGYYSIAEKIFFAVRQVLGIFSQVVYPHICQLTRIGKRESARFFKQFYMPFLMLLLLGCIAVFVLSPYIIQIFLGREQDLPILLLRILSFVPVIVCLNIPAYQVLLAFDRKKSYFKILVSATIVSLITNLLFCSRWGAVGTSVSVIITELFVTSGLNWELKRNKLTAFVNYGII